MSDAVISRPAVTGDGAAPGRSLRAPRDLSVATATALVAVATTGFGLVVFFARRLTDAGIAAPAVAFHRYLITAVVMLPFLGLSSHKRSTTAWAMLAGLGMGLGWIAYVEAIEAAEVATVGVVYMTYPLFTLVAAWAVFGQRPSRRSVLGGVLVVIAAGVALSPAAVDRDVLAKLVVALVAPLTFGFAIAVLTERLVRIDPLERIAGVTLGAVLGLSPLIIRLSWTEVIPSDGAGWALIVGVGVGTALVPMFAYSVAAPFIGAARTAIAGAVELPTIFVIGWLAFGESIGWPQLFAGALIVTAVVVTPSRPPPAAMVEPAQGSGPAHDDGARRWRTALDH